MDFVVPSALAGLWTFVALAFGVLTVVVHCLFALAVWRDSEKLVQAGQQTVLVEPRIWGLAALIGGVFVAGAYWVMHRSTLQAGLESRRQRFRSHPEQGDSSG